MAAPASVSVSSSTGFSSRFRYNEGGTPMTSPRAATWLTVGSGILLLLIPATSSSLRSPALSRAASALV